MEKRPIQFRTDQQGLDVDPTNGAVIKGKDGYTPLTFKNQIDPTYILSPAGNVIFAQAGQENVVVPGNMAVEIPANTLGTFKYSNNDNMDNMQYAQEGGASSEQQQQQLIQMVAQSLQQGADPKQIMQQLVKMGMSVEQAQQIVMAVAQQMQSSQEQESQQEDEMMQEDEEMQGQGMMEEGGEPCFDCFDHYNPSPQAQNLNWFYKEEGGQSLPKANLGNLGNFLGNFGNTANMGNFGMNPQNNPMFSNLYSSADKENMLMNQARLGQVPINNLPEKLQTQMHGINQSLNNVNALKAGGQSFTEAFPQAQTYLPYDRAGETTPNFMFKTGGQSDITKIYQMMKHGGMDHNPKKKKGSKFKGVDEFAKYLNGGSLPKAADGINYNDPNYVYKDLSGRDRKIKFDNRFNTWQYEGDDGQLYDLPANEAGYYDMYYNNNPGVAGQNKAASTNPDNNQGTTNQGTNNQGTSSNAGTQGGANPYLYSSNLAGNAITQLLGNQAGAGIGLLGQALGALGVGAGGMGGMGLGMMGMKPKFRGTFYNQDGKKQHFRSKGLGAIEAVPAYFGMFGNQGTGTNTTPGANPPAGGGTNPPAGGTPDTNAGANTAGSAKGWDMSVMNNDKSFHPERYHNQNRALRHYNRGLNDKDFEFKGKGWRDVRYAQKFMDPKYSGMIDPSQDSFDWHKYNNPNKALRDYQEGLANDNIYYRKGKGWEATNELMRPGYIRKMQEDPLFHSDRYSNIDRALRHYGDEDGIYSGHKGWGDRYNRPRRRRNPTFEYGGMSEYEPGGQSMGNWTFSYRTPFSGMNSYMNNMAFESGVLSGIQENNKAARYKNAQDNFNTVSTGLGYEGQAYKTPSPNGTPSSVGTTNYMGMNNYYPGNQNFGYNNFPSSYLTNADNMAKTGGSILDHYEDGSEVDLTGLSPEEQQAFIQSIMEAGGSVEYI